MRPTRVDVDPEAGDHTVSFLITAPSLLIAFLLVLHMGMTGIAIAAAEDTAGALGRRFGQPAHLGGLGGDSGAWLDTDVQSEICPVLEAFGRIGATFKNLAVGQTTCTSTRTTGWIEVTGFEADDTATTECNGVKVTIKIKVDSSLGSLIGDSVSAVDCATIDRIR